MSRTTNAPALPCPDCGGSLTLRKSRFGPFYGCSSYPYCKGSHGAHPDGTPLGIPATAEVKKLRVRAHELLEERFGRKGYFAWLQRLLGISRREAHIAMLDKRQLTVVITTLEGGWDDLW